MPILGSVQAASLADQLASSAVTTAELRGNFAKGFPDTLNQAVTQSNVVGSDTVTGTITNIGSINSNAGITTVLQNTGNNSLFQTSTILNITIH
jgi:hypothetical protein